MTGLGTTGLGTTGLGTTGLGTTGLGTTGLGTTGLGTTGCRVVARVGGRVVPLRCLSPRLGGLALCVRLAGGGALPRRRASGRRSRVPGIFRRGTQPGRGGILRRSALVDCAPLRRSHGATTTHRAHSVSLGRGLRTGSGLVLARFLRIGRLLQRTHQLNLPRVSYSVADASSSDGSLRIRPTSDHDPDTTMSRARPKSGRQDSLTSGMRACRDTYFLMNCR